MRETIAGLAKPRATWRITRAYGLKPHRVGTFKVSNDPRFAEKLEVIVGLYLNPFDSMIRWIRLRLEASLQFHHHGDIINSVDFVM
jgi:hypothetical protein